MFIVVVIWPSSSPAINIVMTFDAELSDSPAFDPNGAQLQLMMAAAEEYWQDIIEDAATLNITYYWDDLSDAAGFYAVHNNQGTSGGRPIAALIRFDTQFNGSDRLWYIDPTPTNNDEFDMQQTLYGDLSTADQIDWYNGSPPDLLEVSYVGDATALAPADAQNGVDLFSAALHEVGHALGMTTAVAKTETDDFDYDFDPVFVNGTTSAAQTAGGNRYHLDADGTRMAAAVSTGQRVLPSATDVFSIATAPNPGWEDIDLKRQDFWGGNWQTPADWEGNRLPDSADDAFVRHGGAVAVDGTAVVSTLLIGGGSTVDVINNDLLSSINLLTVGDTDTAVLNVNSGATVATDELVINSAGTVNLAGGTIAADSIDHTSGGTFNFAAGTLRVDTFAGDLTQDGGTLSPGDSPGTTVVDGSYTLNAGSLEIEIGGLSAGSEFDQLVVNGVATINAAAILDVTLIDDFTPSPGDAFDVLTFVSLSGQFDDTTSLSLPDGRALIAQYNATELRLVASYFGDGNLDGWVDGVDYLLWANNFADNTGDDPSGSPGNGDYNNDAVVDGLDYLVWASNFGQHAFATPVPEPGAFLMLVTAVAMLTTRRHRA